MWGSRIFPAGASGDAAAMKLSDSLRKHGLTLGRLKTGTTPRLLRSSIDFSQMEEQPGTDGSGLQFLRAKARTAAGARVM